MALLLCWKLHNGAEARLAVGERLGLFRLRSSLAEGGETHACLEPQSDLEKILESIYDDPADLLSCRWI